MSQQKMVLQPCSGKHISPLRQPGVVDKGGAGELAGPPASFVTGALSFPHYTASTHPLTE